MGNLTTVVNIFIICIVLVQGMADQCTTGSNIVLPCGDMTTPTTHMFIPVNGSILTDGDVGCICDVTVVELPVNSIFTDVSVRILDNNISCGYQVMTGRRIIECQNKSSSSTNINLNQSLSLTFTRDNTPSPPSTAGFCLQVITQNIKVKVTKVCRNIVIMAPKPSTSKPTITAKPVATTKQTMVETTSLQHTIKTSPSNITASVPDELMTIPSNTETLISREFTAKTIATINGDTSTINNGAMQGLVAGVTIGFLLLIAVIIILICIIRRIKKKLADQVSRCTCHRSNASQPGNNMYDVMTAREDNHQYEMSISRDSNSNHVATTNDGTQSAYNAMENRSPENNYQTLEPYVNNGVYVNQQVL